MICSLSHFRGFLPNRPNFGCGSFTREDGFFRVLGACCWDVLGGLGFMESQVTGGLEIPSSVRRTNRVIHPSVIRRAQ